MSAGVVNAAKATGENGRCRVSHLFLLINETLYGVQPLESERAFRLNKSDGTLYDVAQTPHGARCDCPDFIFRRDGLDPSGCKHVQALAAQGLIANRAGRAVAGR